MLLALIQIAIAAAYVTIGFSVVPRIRFGAKAAVFGTAFFLTCAATHFDLALHTAARADPFLLDAHMWVIHTVQVVVDWAFIIATRHWRIELHPRQDNADRRWLRFFD